MISLKHYKHYIQYTQITVDSYKTKLNLVQGPTQGGGQGGSAPLDL